MKPDRLLERRLEGGVEFVIIGGVASVLHGSTLVTRDLDEPKAASLRNIYITTDAGRAKFMSDLQEKITNFTTPLVFFTLEINRLPDDHLDGLYAQNADLARYKPVFDRIRAMKPYQLSDELEKFPDYTRK